MYIRLRTRFSREAVTILNIPISSTSELKEANVHNEGSIEDQISGDCFPFG